MTATWKQNYPFLARIEGDLIYGLLLAVCAIIATLLRKKASLEIRRNVDGIIGFIITVVICKQVAFYSLVVVLAHLVAIRFLPHRQLVLFSFYGTFIYLGFLRVIHNFGFPKLEFIGNAIQLLMTLRVIGLSYEIFDSKESERRKLEKKDDDETKKDENRRFINVPSTWEAFNYCYSFIGLFTGPYYTYQTYYDAMHSEHLQKISVRSLLLAKIKTLSWTLPTLIGFYILGPVESSDGFRSGMRAWNRSVQFWLANFVYKRSHKAIRMPYTMFISAFWHGIHPGYFLSFLTIPLCTTAEDLVFAAIPRDEKTGQHPRWFSIIWRFIRMKGFEMMACGFLLLTWEDTVRLWSCLYWWLHFFMITIAGISFLIVSIRKKPKKKE
ncbi:hypothetical protein FO519_001419 [Halicephalobus sp. NKZ332]|nr:hypothetical protein FO519_001419 [Halicephalobus sp. NKZ332]